MSRKRCRRRAQAVNPLAYQAALMGACKMTFQDASRRAIGLCLAVDEARQGRQSAAHWREIFDAINITNELVRSRVAQDPAGNIAALEKMAVDIMARFNTSGSAALRFDELRSLREFAADYAALLQGVTMGEYFNACAKVENRTARVLSGERMQGARVVQAPGWVG
jgi:hypothetical protein